MIQPLTKDSAIYLLLRGSLAKACEGAGANMREAGCPLRRLTAAPLASPVGPSLASRATSLLTVLLLTVRPASRRAWRIASDVWPSKCRRRISDSNSSALRLSRPGGFLGVSLMCAFRSRI